MILFNTTTANLLFINSRFLNMPSQILLQIKQPLLRKIFLIDILLDEYISLQYSLFSNFSSPNTSFEKHLLLSIHKLKTTFRGSLTLFHITGILWMYADKFIPKDFYQRFQFIKTHLIFILYVNKNKTRKK